MKKNKKHPKVSLKIIKAVRSVETNLWTPEFEYELNGKSWLDFAEEVEIPPFLDPATSRIEISSDLNIITLYPL